MTLKGSEKVVLNGEHVRIVVNHEGKPKWIPWFLWKMMVRTVVARQRVTIKRD